MCLDVEIICLLSQELPIWNRGVGRDEDDSLPPLALVDELLSSETTTPVYTFELRRMHGELFLHESLRDMIHTMEKEASRQSPALSMCNTASASARVTKKSEVILRSLLGLSGDGQNQTSAWIHTLLGRPGTKERLELCEWLQGRMQDTMSQSQRAFFAEFENSLTALHCVPGAGKTLILELLVLILVERPKEHPIKLIITEPNVTMCAEVFERLCKRLGSPRHVLGSIF